MISSYLGVFVLLVVTSIPSSQGFVRVSKGDVDDITSDRINLVKLQEPLCTSDGTSANCCATVTIPTDTKLCSKVSVNLKELKANAAISINDKDVIEKGLSVGRLCYPVGPITKACLDIYHVAVDLGQKKVESCTRVVMSSFGKDLVTKDMGCIRFEDGKVSQSVLTS